MGGLYLDDDSYLETPLEHIVKPRDELIMTIERNPFKDNCYVPSFHASAVAVAKKYSVYANVTKTPLHHKYMNWALVSWGIFAAPGHAAILKMLENMVEVLWAEYNRNSMIWNLSTDRRWKIVMCTTGPAMLTATIREYWAEAMANETLRNSITNHMRVELTDFKDYGGMFKVHALYNGHYNVDKQHYMVTMQKQYISLLHTYVPFNISKLEKKAVTPGGKKVYWVENGALHLFPNYDTMMSKNITAKDAGRGICTHTLSMSYPIITQSTYSLYSSNTSYPFSVTYASMEINYYYVCHPTLIHLFILWFVSLCRELVRVWFYARGTKSSKHLHLPQKQQHKDTSFPSSCLVVILGAIVG